MKLAEERVDLVPLSVPELLEDIEERVTAYPGGELNRFIYFKMPVVQLNHDDPSMVYYDDWSEDDLWQDY